MNVESLTTRFVGVFKLEQATVLAQAITDAYNDLVKTNDFNELKATTLQLAEAQERTEVRLGQLAEAQERTEVRLGQLAEAQERTEVRLEQLTVAQEELTEAQERTEVRLGQLAEAQERTEVRLEQLAEAQERTEVRLEQLTVAQEKLTEAQERTETNLDRLTQTVSGLASELGGLSRSMSYSLENEAYRVLPGYLQAHHGIVIEKPFVRTDIGGEEINLFGRGQQQGQAICIVGESKAQLDERRSNRREAYRVLAQLDRKVEAVQQVYPDCKIVRLLITHYARPGFLQRAREHNVLVVQSFEW